MAAAIKWHFGMSGRGRGLGPLGGARFVRRIPCRLCGGRRPGSSGSPAGLT